MRYQARFLPALLLLCLLAASRPTPVTAGPATDETLVLVKAVEVSGQPSAIVVDRSSARNDIIFYDGDRIRFLDGDSLTVAPQQISLPTREWEGWMAYDRYHHQAYVLTTRLRETPLRVPWKEAQVHVIANRASLGAFSVNDSQNSDPSNPADGVYVVEGLTLKQPMSEGGNPARLFVDDAENGNVDVLDLDAAGTAVARAQRYSYRAPVSGFTRLNAGNTLALEPSHETLATDDLASTDLLFIADKNRFQGGFPLNGRIRCVRLNHPLQDLNAVPQSDVDLSGTFPFGNSAEGIAVAGRQDLLYVASSQQSFDDGFVAEVHSTSRQMKKLISPKYADPGFVHVDWHDPNRVFVATFDVWYNDPHQGLYLHLLVDGVVVDTLRLMENYDEFNGLRGMAFDPTSQRLYLTVGGRILVVEVTGGGPPPPVCPKPLTGVRINGPGLGSPDTTYTFNALPSPGDATQPVSYTWSPQPLSGQGTARASYRWPAAGNQSVAIEAENCGGKHTASLDIRLGDWEQVYLPMIVR